MALEEIANGSQRTGEVLLVAIQVGDYIAARPPQAPVYCIVHARILFHESFDSLVSQQPVLRPVVRACVLHDVFDLPSLVSDGSDAELQPV
jgi:hypothetical protein